MPAIQFQSIEPLHNKKSLFNLSFEHTTTGDMGLAIPIMCKEAIPSDVWKMNMRMILRFLPMVAPILHPIYCKTYTFFVPNRILFPKKPVQPINTLPETDLRNQEIVDVVHNWENFITGGEEGTDDSMLPLANPTTLSQVQAGSLWDYFGLPNNGTNPQNIPDADKPMALPFRAYNLIWNEFIRDQNLQDKVDLDDLSIKRFCWEKDYFTSALPFQQRGDAIAIPLSGLGNAEFTNPNMSLPLTYGIGKDSSFIGATNVIANGNYPSAPTPTNFVYSLAPTNWTQIQSPTPYGYTNIVSFNPDTDGYPVTPHAVKPMYSLGSPNGQVDYNFKVPLNTDFINYLNSNSIDLSNLGQLDINDLRTGFQEQKWLERNARCGSRYIEQLKARFGEDAGDQRLDRPEFIGATKTPILISEVLQTAQNNTAVGGQPSTALGTMASHGVSADDSYIGTYKVKEHGWIITLLCVRPETMYSQGIDLQFTRRSRYDFFMPEFQNLSEQAVLNREVYCSSTDTVYNNTIFGYQGRHNEYRYAKNMVTGLMKISPTAQGLAHWNLGRLFSDTSKPLLNGDFVSCNPDKSRIMAVPSQPTFVLNYGAINSVVRPMQIIPEPGLVDHH